MEQQFNNMSRLREPCRGVAVVGAAYYIKYAASLLRDKELYREDVESLAAALRELQEVVIQGTERGARAALLKPRTQARDSMTGGLV
jgi:hypothetical protein